MSDDDTYTGWAVLELFGHRRLTGQISEQTIAGQAFLRLDVPSDPPVTQFYAPSAVYCITPTTEDVARAAMQRPQPIALWELERPDMDANKLPDDDGWADQ